MAERGGFEPPIRSSLGMLLALRGKQTSLNGLDTPVRYATLLCLMASLHKQPGKPYWFCAFSTPDGRRHFKSTGTDIKSQANKICAGWVKASELAGQKNLTADRARKLIDATIADVLE